MPLRFSIPHQLGFGSPGIAARWPAPLRSRFGRSGIRPKFPGKRPLPNRDRKGAGRHKARIFDFVTASYGRGSEDETSGSWRYTKAQSVFIFSFPLDACGMRIALAVLELKDRKSVGGFCTNDLP